MLWRVPRQKNPHFLHGALCKVDSNAAPTPFHKAPPCTHTMHRVYQSTSKFCAGVPPHRHTEATAPPPGRPFGIFRYGPFSPPSRRASVALAQATPCALKCVKLSCNIIPDLKPNVESIFEVKHSKISLHIEVLGSDLTLW